MSLMEHHVAMNIYLDEPQIYAKKKIKGKSEDYIWCDSIYIKYKIQHSTT